MRYLIVLLLAGCASTGVVQTGDDTYMLAKRSSTDSGGEIMADLYREASAHCGKDGKKVLQTSSKSRDTVPFRPGNAELHFRCVEK